MINIQKYEETHQFVISRECERKKKKQLKNAAIGGVKVQFKWQGINKSNGLTNVAVLGLHSPVMTSRHQGN